MSFLWIIQNMLALMVSFGALIILYLIYRKMNEPLFKYAFYTRIISTFSFLVQIIMMLIFYSQSPPKEHNVIFAITFQILYTSGIIIEIYCFQKMIQKTPSLLTKIIFALLFIFATAEFFSRIQSADPLTIVIPLVISRLLGFYLLFQLKKQHKTIQSKHLLTFLKLFVYLSVGATVVTLLYIIVINVFPHLAILFEYIDFMSLFPILLNILIIIFIGRYFFTPAEKQELKVAEKIQNFVKLTPKEKELIEHLVKGLSTKDISEKMCVSNQTVKNYTHRLYKKINISSKIELIHWIQNRSLG